jgi:hypothetical protein
MNSVIKELVIWGFIIGIFVTLLVGALSWGIIHVYKNYDIVKTPATSEVQLHETQRHQESN